MKLALLILTAVLPAGVTALRAADETVTIPQLQAIGMLPSDKMEMRPENRINPKKKNPFAERTKPKAATVAETVETEESKIRAFFDAQKVTGITRDNGKVSVLLGDIILEEGKQVPPVLPGQTQILRVGKITDKALQFFWVEGAGFEQAVPRQYVKMIQLAPRIAVALPGQAVTGSGTGVTYLDESFKVVWPKVQARDPAQIVGTLPPATNGGTVSLTDEEESRLMQLANPDTGLPSFIPADTSTQGTPVGDGPTGEEDPVIGTPEPAFTPAPDQQNP